MKRQMLAVVVGVGVVASALAGAVAADVVQNAAGSSAAGALLKGAGDDGAGIGGGSAGFGGGGTGGGGFGGGGEGGGGTGGGGTGGGGEGGGGTGGGGEGGGGGGTEESVILSGAYTYTCQTNNTLAGQSLVSTMSDQNVILAQTNAFVTVSNCVLNKTGDTSNADNSNFFALNAVVAAKTASLVCIDHSTLSSDAEGANSLFASGTGSTIYAYGCAISSTNNSSRGLDATYGGTVIASKMDISTEGMHCAALATDRGNGSISVTDATLSTKGNGSPLLYSTGAIEVNGVTGTATGAQIAGIEGLSAIRIKNSDLSGSGKKASEPVVNGVIIYQSNSGDSAEGTATFEVSDSTLNTAITNGAMFYVTHSAAIITVQNTVLDFDTSVNYLIKAAGNDGSNGWGTAGSNGGGVVFTAINQTLAGDISVDGISSNDLYLVNSKYTGTIVKDTTYEGDGGANVFIDGDSTWIVTSNCTLKTLTASSGAKITDGNGASVPIVDAENQQLVSGASALKITVANYKAVDFTATNITDFTVSRDAFDAIYGTAQDAGGSGSGSGGSSGGGADDHNNWTNYFKPYPPANAIVKVKVDGATEYGLPDKDHKYCLDGYWDGSAAGVKVRLLYVSQEAHLFSDGSTSNVWETVITNNAQEVYPPAGVETVKAQAKSGSTDYLTLKAAVEAAKSRAKISIYDDIALAETLTVTNSITLDLATNVITLGSALTNAFHFTAGGTVSNGTINSALAANVEGSALLRFTDGKVTLKDLTVNGGGYETVVARDAAASSEKKPSTSSMTCDGLVLTGNGCLLSVDRTTVTLTNDCAFTIDGAQTTFGAHAAAIYCASNGTVSILGGTYVAPTVLLADDYSVFFKSDAVEIAAPAGYVWENGKLVAESSGGQITPGEASAPYDDAQSATNAAATINADKAAYIAVPTGVENSAKETYLAKVAATVTSDNCVVVDLTAAAKIEEQALVDAAITNETVVASLVSTNASAQVTLATTTPGLYYWIEGGTDVDAVTECGAATLSTNGGSVDLTKPTLDTTQGRAFFRISGGLSNPAP